ncbi:DUF3105 domain-containing protein [Halobaculum sp. EA56]|uniref:DUF3105 domain-containing protein n=1 Tax=Halobaculum sp. EA56 TaxID=3421648 RepID=UPI003EB9E123
MTDGDDPATPSTRPLSRRRALAGLGAGAVGALAGCLGGGGGGIESEPLPEQGDPALLEGVKQFPSEGADHVRQGTDIEYDTQPPTSGPHYGTTVPAGFYTEPKPLGALVHTLEHGAVVAYYVPDALTDEAEESLRAFARNFTGTWRSFVAVPNPYDDPEAPYTLTAWRHLLRMEEYDAEVVRAFCAEFLGRGPENPVR